KVVADGLVLPDRLAETLALLRIPQRIVEGGRRDPQRPRCHLNTPRLKAFHHLRETRARLTTEDRRRRHPTVVERQLTRLDTLVTQLGQIARHREPRA